MLVCLIKKDSDSHYKVDHKERMVICVSYLVHASEELIFEIHQGEFAEVKHTS
jgi:hypothetical protein